MYAVFLGAFVAIGIAIWVSMNNSKKDPKA